MADYTQSDRANSKDQYGKPISEGSVGEDSQSRTKTALEDYAGTRVDEAKAKNPDISPKVTHSSGAIHGARLEAFQIVLASNFRGVDPDTWIRFNPDSVHDDMTSYSIGIDQDTINTFDSQSGDVYISEPFDDLYFTKDGDTGEKERVLVKLPKSACDICWDIAKDGYYAAEFTNEEAPKWQVNVDWVEYLITESLNQGHPIVLRYRTLHALFEPHDTHTIDGASPVITDESRISSDYYESVNTSQENCSETPDGSGISHPVYHLQNGNCPVGGCGFAADEWRKLRGHVGGMVAAEGEDGPHDQIDLRLAEREFIPSDES